MSNITRTGSYVYYMCSTYYLTLTTAVFLNMASQDSTAYISQTTNETLRLKAQKLNAAVTITTTYRPCQMCE